MPAAQIHITNPARAFERNLTRPGRILLLVPTTSYRIGDFLAAAERLGVKVAVGSDQLQVLEQFSGGHALTLAFKSAVRAVAQIEDFNRTYPLSGIVGVDDETTLIAAMAAKALKLRHNEPEAVAITRNKHRFRSRLANSGLLTPWFTLSPVGDDPKRTAEELPYPVVLKPLALSASRGVIRADNRREFIVAFNRIRSILENVGSEADSADQILIEGYIPGVEVALEGILDNGRLTVLALFDKPDPLEGPFFEETIYVTPSRLPSRVRHEIATTVKRAVATLGLREGPIHAELRINDKGAWLIEVAARSIGGLCSRTLSFGEDGRLEDLILRHALQQPQSAAEIGHRSTGVMMIPTPGAGILRQVVGVEDARELPGIDNVTIAIPIGETLVPVPEGSRYFGFVFASGEAPEHVEAVLREAHGLLSFTVEPS
jgi:biotin carboxylase